jgi:hypothetical protein
VTIDRVWVKDPEIVGGYERALTWVRYPDGVKRSGPMGTLDLLRELGGLAGPRCLTRLAMSTLEKMAPKIAVPNDPPIDRKKVAPEVATPSSE